MDKNEPLVLIDGDLLLLSPEYYKKGLPGATKEMYLRQCVYDKLLLAHTFLPAGYRGNWRWSEVTGYKRKF